MFQAIDLTKTPFCFSCLCSPPPSPTVLCSERVGQVTKTYHDIKAVTHLLEEVRGRHRRKEAKLCVCRISQNILNIFPLSPSRQKERDLELAARIGQSLLKQNQELTTRNEMLDEQLEIAKEEVRREARLCVCAFVASWSLTRCLWPRQIAQLRHELSMRDDLLQFYASTEEIENAESHSQ